jgi:hypothetical protein
LAAGEGKGPASLKHRKDALTASGGGKPRKLM